MKISEAFDLYYQYMTIKGQSPRVLETHNFVKKTLIYVLGDLNIEEINLDMIFRWRGNLSTRKLPDGRSSKRAPNTIRCYILRIRAVLKYLELIGVECMNYELIPIPKREDICRTYLTEQEVTNMIDCACSLRNKFVISLLYSSGIRLSEMISLDRDSIKKQRFTVVGKGKKSRLCFIDDRTEQLMKEYLASRKDDCPALIVSDLYKARMTPTNVQLLVKNSAKRAGIERKITPHVLRHSFATNFINNNGDIRPLSMILGHANLDTTAIYTHIVDNRLESQYRQFHTI